MKGDFTRDTFDASKHFTRVLMQQGRVQLDADWNEQAAILLHYLQTLAVDLIGPHGGPGDGFKIIGSPQTPGEMKNDFAIENGHYYADGILCELGGIAVPINVVSPTTRNQVKVSTWVVDNREFEEKQYVEVFDAVQPPSNPPMLFQITTVNPTDKVLTLDRDLSFTDTSVLQLRRITTYLTQPDYPLQEDRQLTAGQKYLVYLDVWERHISYLEDGGNINIREVALGGPDTATRAKVVWQVKARESENPPPTEEVEKLLKLSSATLRARARQSQSPSAPCVIHPDARYRGAENQLYRVEIHTGGKLGDHPPPTFKWSRENGSVVFPIILLVTNATDKTTVVMLAHLGHDDKLGLRETDWVEIVDDDYTLQNRAEQLLKVHTIDRDAMTITLDGVLPPQVGLEPSKHPLLRRWDYQEKKDKDPKQGGLPFSLGNDNAVQIMEKHGEDGPNWFVLEDGVQIQFQPDGDYRTGDYWLIPARFATGDVEWPGPADNPKAVPPHGVKHHYAPLASISVDTVGNVTVMKSYRRIINQLWTLES